MSSINFSQGIAHLDPLKVGEDSYYLLINGRTRHGSIQGIKAPQPIDSLPAGKYQGVYAFQDTQIVFIAGKAYYKIIGSDSYDEVPDFQMSATADFLYAESIPASFVNFKRSGTVSSVSLSSRSTPSEAAILVQDGVNQPELILPDLTSRVTKTYDEWENTVDGGEYVPIGILPKYIDGILYVIVKDSFGRHTKIARSVTGRPLDFVINVDINGDKIPDEDEGGAISTSYAVSSEAITAIVPVPGNDGSFVVSTRRKAFVVNPNYSSTLFAEPTFNNVKLFDTGANNQFSIVDVSGDTVFIDAFGLQSFNAIRFFQNEGRGAPFSREVSKLLLGAQNNTAAIVYNNYAYFAVNTIYGSGIFVYDLTIRDPRVATDTGRFVSLDIYSTGAIKQFSELRGSGVAELFFITENKLWKVEGSSVDATTIFIPRAYTPRVDMLELIASKASNTWFSVHFFCDGVSSDTVSARTPVAVPIDRELVINLEQTEQQTHKIILDTGKPFIGSKILPVISFSSASAEVSAVIIEPIADASVPRLDMKSGDYVKQLAFTADGGEVNANSAAVISDIEKTDVDYVILGGDNNYSSDVAANYSVPWVNFIKQNKMLVALGNHDLDLANNGKAFIDVARMPGNGRYFYKDLEDADTILLFLSSGLNTALALVEPDGNTVGSAQYKWLKNTLELRPRKHRIAIFHHPPYTNDPNYAPGITDLRWDFNNMGIKLVLNGHGHQYERFLVDGVTYAVVGTGGKQIRSIVDPPQVGAIKSIDTAYGRLDLSIGANAIQGHFIGTASTTPLDSFIVYG